MTPTRPNAAGRRGGAPDPEPPILEIRSTKEWEDWLERNHAATPGGVWLRLYRKGVAERSIDHSQAVEGALCFGWIDGQGRRLDERSRLQRFTPRRPRSLWSKLNRERAERLIEAGRMRPAGLREVEAAKADGRWERAYDPPSRAEIPADFLAELRKHPKAEAFFATLGRRDTYPVAYRLQTARTPEIRARRMQAIIAMLERGEKLHG